MDEINCTLSGLFMALENLKTHIVPGRSYNNLYNQRLNRWLYKAGEAPQEFFHSDEFKKGQDDLVHVSPTVGHDFWMYCAHLSTLDYLLTVAHTGLVIDDKRAVTLRILNAGLRAYNQGVITSRMIHLSQDPKDHSWTLTRQCTTGATVHLKLWHPEQGVTFEVLKNTPAEAHTL